MDNIWGGLSDGGWIFNYRAPLGWITSSKTWLGIWKALGKVSHVGYSCILALCPRNNWPHMEQHLGYKHDPSPIFLSFFPQCTTQIYFLLVILLKSLHLFLFFPQYSRFFSKRIGKIKKFLWIFLCLLDDVIISVTHICTLIPATHEKERFISCKNWLTLLEWLLSSHMLLSNIFRVN